MGQDALQARVKWPARRGQADHAGGRSNQSGSLRRFCDHPYPATPKSFRVNTGDVGALQARSNAWRTAQLTMTVRVHQHVWRRDAYIRRAGVREKMECEAAQSHCTQTTGVVSRVRSA
jgi:hypothetical protein